MIELTKGVRGNVRRRVLWLVIPAVGLTACYKSTLPPGQCKNELMSELLSGDKLWKAVLFSRQCGDSPSELQVSVFASQASLSNEAGNAFRQDASHEGGGRHSFSDYPATCNRLRPRRGGLPSRSR